MCFRDYLNDSISHLSDVCCLIYLCLSIFFNKSIDCFLTQGVDIVSMNLLLALKSCSIARALTLQILFLVLKEYTIVATCKPTFADFTQVHVQIAVIML